MLTGKITSPSDGTNLTFLPGSTETITWTFDDGISKVENRRWSFKSSDDNGFGVLALLPFNGNPTLGNKLPRFDIIKPGSLVLHDVNQSYDGTYQFALTVDGAQKDDVSNVRVYIASKFDLRDINKVLIFKISDYNKSNICFRNRLL